MRILCGIAAGLCVGSDRRGSQEKDCTYHERTCCMQTRFRQKALVERGRNDGHCLADNVWPDKRNPKPAQSRAGSTAAVMPAYEVISLKPNKSEGKAIRLIKLMF